MVVRPVVNKSFRYVYGLDTTYVYKYPRCEFQSYYSQDDLLVIPYFLQ